MKIAEAEGRVVKLLEGEHKGRTLFLTFVDPASKSSVYVNTVSLPDMKRFNFTVKGAIGCRAIPDRSVTKLLTKERIPALLASTPGASMTIGTDPELFVMDKKNVVIPAFEFLPKKSKSNTIFWDGFQAEFVTDTDASMHRYCLAYLTDHVHSQLQKLQLMAQKHDKQAKLSWKTVVDIPEQMLRTGKREHVELGCEPSLSAYDYIKPLQIDDPASLPIRFAGCHVHMGYRGLTQKRAIPIVKSIDAVFGPMSLLLFRGMEDPRRRRYYGRAGEFRLPKWGLEYRTPSSAMLAHPSLFHLCFDTIRVAAKYARSPVMAFWKGDQDDVVEAINTYDMKLAKKLFDLNKDLYGDILTKVYHGSTKVSRTAIRLIEKGALAWYKNLDDMDASWRLSSSWSTHSGSKDCCMAGVASDR